MVIERSCACGVTPGWAWAALARAAAAHDASSSARRPRLTAAVGCELRLNRAPFGRQLNRHHDTAGLARRHQTKSDRLLNLRPRDRAAEDLLARGVLLD